MSNPPTITDKAAEHPCAETPWEELRQMALKDYEEKATATHSWSSVVPRAINYYFDHARSTGDATCEWQPIETAPKDGTNVLFYTPESDEIGWLAFVAESFLRQARGVE